VARIVRKQNPPAFRNYKRYKPFLRLDFDARCAYCDIPELRYGPPRNYTVDHFRPKSIPEFRGLLRAYSNLFYVCQDCNAAKGSAWPSAELQALGFRFVDPCLQDLADHFPVGPDGLVTARTRQGEYMVARVRLNRPYLRAWRRSKDELLAQISDVADLTAAFKPGTTEHSAANRIHLRLQDQLLREFGSSLNP
jgi:hypothetical protein